MASIHKDPRGKSPYWYVAYTLADGRRVFRSTRQTDRKKAAEAARTLERAIQAARQGELTETRVRKWLDEMLESTGLSPVRAATVRSFFEEWLSGKRLSVTPAAARRYERALKLFIEGLGMRADKPLSGITASDLAAYRNARLTENVASGTLAHYLKAVRSMFATAKRQGLVAINPAEAIDTPRKRMHERSVFTIEEIKALLSAASLEWATLVLLGFYTGARLMDLAHLGWNSVDLVNGIITFVQSKTGAKVAIPVHPVLAEHLLSIATDQGGPLCPVLSATPATGRSGLSKPFTRLMRAAGIDPQVVQTSKNAFSTKSFHSLRHSFASVLANSGVSADIRMKLTGHRSAAVHLQYTHMQLEQLRGAVNALPRLSEK
jgi:integrase